jgi:hypothetical protein
MPSTDAEGGFVLPALLIDYKPSNTMNVNRFPSSQREDYLL